MNGEQRMKNSLRTALLAVSLALTGGTTFGAPPAMQVDGRPFFPLGWYASDCPGSVEASRQYLGEQKAQGMNCVLACYGTWLSDTCQTNQMQGAALNDMKALFEVHRYAVLEQPGYPIALIDDQVDLLKDYPNMIGWYLIDEPELQGLSPSQTQARYAQVKGRDPDHSIYVVHSANHNWQPSRADPYLDAEPPPYTDIVMTDSYLCMEGTPEFGNTLYETAAVSRYHADSASVHGKTAHISVVQTHQGWGLRLPTYAEQRYISYSPIVAGARGILYWMYNGGYTTEDHKNNVVAPIAREISRIIPAILSNSNELSVFSDHDTDSWYQGIPDIIYLFGEDAAGGYVIAVNNTGATRLVTMDLTGDILQETFGPSSATIPVMFESRNVTLQTAGDPKRRTLTDTFSPYDVNVYRVYTFGKCVSVDLGSPDIAEEVTHPQQSDGHSTAANTDGRNCRRNTTPAADLYLYFQVSDSFAYQGSVPDLYIAMDYYDTGTGALGLEYDAADSPYKNGGSVALTGSNTWKRHTFHVTDAYFGNRQNGACDFRIACGAGSTMYLDTVQVSREDPGSPVAVVSADVQYGAPPLAVDFDGAGSYDQDGSIVGYQWDFDNNGSIDATGPTAGHAYSAGNYVAALAVTDNQGLTNKKTIRVRAYTPACYSDKFSYSDSGLNGNGGWAGSAGSQIAVEGQKLKISGGAGSVDAVRIVPAEDGGTGVISVFVNVKRGVGGTPSWNLWVDDAMSRNLGRWSGSGYTVRGYVGSGTQTTALQNLSGGWENLRMDVYAATNETGFYFNGQFIGKMSHSATGAGNALGRLRFERADQSGAAGQYVYLDELAVVGIPATIPGSVSGFTAMAGDSQVTLSWTNPTDPDLAGTTVRYRNDAYPSSPNDGSLVCDRTSVPGSNDGYVHTGLNNYQTYFYSAFAYDGHQNYSAAANASAQPAGAPGPPVATSPANGSTVSTATPAIQWSGATHDAYQVRVSRWNNPNTSVDGWDSGVVSSAGNSAACGALGDVTAYYVFVRLHNFIGWGVWSAAGHHFIVNTNDANNVFYPADAVPSASGWTIYGGYESGPGISSSTVSEGGSNVYKLIDSSNSASCKARKSVSNISFDTGASVAARMRCSTFSGSGNYNLGISNGGVGGMFLALTTSSVSLVDKNGTVRGSYSLDGTVYHKYQLAVKNSTPGNNATAVWRAYVDGVERLSWTGAGVDDGFDGFMLGNGGTLSTGTWYFDWVAGRSDGEFSPSAWDPANLEFNAPGSPSVTDEGAFTGSVSRLDCSWSSVSGASQYRYRIGASPGAYDVADWTNTGASTSVERSGLTLSDGATYYFTVEAGTASGAWGQVGVSDGISTATAIGIQAAKALADGQIRAIRGRAVSAAFSGYFYIQEADRPWGIKVVSSQDVDPGNSVDIAGAVSGSGAERHIDCSGNAVEVTSPGPGVPSPTAMNNASLGGTALNAYTPGVAGGIGPNNIGSLVMSWGKVSDISGLTYKISDGSGVAVTVEAPNAGAVPGDGEYAVVTGVITRDGSGERLIKIPPP